ncbi:MAG: SAVED domain-containing protein [Bacteroidia bacterium]|jgi:hypothetical protein|nr:SAVED domain-containing protein [Bacteroidia bacterium]
MSNKIVIIKHTIHNSISNEEVEAALSEELFQSERIFVEVVPVKVSLDESGDIHWPTAARHQKQQFEQEIKPILDSNPDAIVAYFGLAPIPLAAHLGYLVGPFRKTKVFQRHHETKSWKWPNSGNEDKGIALKCREPKELFEMPSDVILRVKTSFDISPEITTELVKEHSREIDIQAKELSKDFFESEAQIERFANDYCNALDSIATFLPKTDTIHLFAAIPVGLAFLIGAKINPNVHPRVQTYQFSKIKNGSYEPALALQNQSNDPEQLTGDEKNAVDELRELLIGEYERIKTYTEWVGKNRDNDDTSWATTIFEKGKIPSKLTEGRWGYMPAISDTPILDSFIDKTVTNSGEQFYDDPRRAWLLDDYFLHALKKRLVEIEKIKQAFRLFIFHESLHFQLGLSSYQAQGIGRFPRVLEEADFYADVWAMINEYGFTRFHSGTAQVLDSSNFFSSLIELAIETFWAFDTNADMSRPQVRRVNRYLIWYYMMAQLRLSKIKGIDDAIERMTVKPIVDLRGPTTKSDPEGRVEYLFNGKASTPISMAVYDYQNRITRLTTDNHIPLQELPKAFITRDGNRLKELLNAFFDAVK